ncbi:VOC family protein [Pararhizobium sp. PWRC1-1]|uniref:VOC family protein n=1 Tax=Pararhizobium sp. PWRC1-1 TaxID=2804566 RepID=UPI003CF9FEB4
MEFHRGRLIDHVHLRVKDLATAKTFYRAVLATVGVNIQHESDKAFAADELYVDVADDYVSRVHLAFQAKTREEVRAFHAAGLANGGTDNGKPSERSYHPGYYAAFLIDPDGNNIEAVFHGPNVRSATSVVITPT